MQRLLPSTLLSIALAGALSSCTSLPQPVITPPAASEPEAIDLLKASSRRSGDPYQRFQRIDVSYEGKWSKIATAIQPKVTDPDFRIASDESYFPRQRKIIQTYRGSAGEKVVTRTRNGIEVTRNGDPVTDEEELDSAALVADCYVIFTFGSSALVELGSDWKVVGRETLAGETCILIAGNVRSGFGKSEEDAVIAWIGEDTKRLHRVQNTLFGLESTARADVDVSYSDFQAGPGNTEWPRHFVERIRRPFDAKAHEWWMTDIEVVR
jgi:hypothetical protein